jgi:phosphoribosylanthranilate isomerase
MLTVKIKICGLTNYKDAAAAVEMGADLLGFNFYPKSPRYIPADDAAKIISKLPAFVDTVGVFVNAPLEQIRKTASQCQLNWVQLHGDEDPAFCKSLFKLNAGIIKAIRIKDQKDIQQVEDYISDAVLLDSFDSKRYGGTGKTFDWNFICHTSKRIFLAGGITPENAAAAVMLNVYAIDVCSGVESEPGKKDHKKMSKLFENIRLLKT